MGTAISKGVFGTEVEKNFDNLKNRPMPEAYGPHRCMIPRKDGGWRMVTWEHTSWAYI